MPGIIEHKSLKVGHDIILGEVTKPFALRSPCSVEIKGKSKLTKAAASKIVEKLESGVQAIIELPGEAGHTIPKNSIIHFLHKGELHYGEMPADFQFVHAGDRTHGLGVFGESKIWRADE